MSELQKQCADMAANMLDAELVAVLRGIPVRQKLTPLQAAVLNETRKRDLMN